MMKKWSMAVTCAALVGALGFAVVAKAADATKDTTKTDVTKDEQTVKGTVEITKDAKGAMQCCIKSADGTMYMCGPDSKCKMLEGDNGKMVECSGVVTEKDGKKMLHIKAINSHPSP